MPDLSIVVVAGDLPRTAGRALQSLSPAQQGVSPESYEILFVETGDAGGAVQIPANCRRIALDDGLASAAAAVNRGVVEARAAAIGIVADAARAVAPGVVAAALRCLACLDRVVLLAQPGLLFLPRALFDELGGYEGGSFHRRAAQLDGVDALALVDEVDTGLPGPRADRRYVDLLKQTLLNEHGLEAEAAYYLARDALEAAEVPFDDTIAFDVRARKPGYFERVRQAREKGFHMGWETRNAGFAQTMVGRARLDNVDECVSTALADGVPGDLVECGVWRGGVTILMRGLLAAYGISDRTVWVADSFQGLPVPDPPQGKLDLSKGPHPELAVGKERVSATFERFGLFDEQVRFLHGWFKDTLPAAPIERIAVLRLDGDIYESTMTTLTALYEKVSPGGFVIVDDYKLIEECREAVDEFRELRGIDDPIVEVDWTGVYWRRAG